MKNPSCQGKVLVAEPRARWHSFFTVACVFGFFALFYIYVWMRIRPELFYHQYPVVFLFDSYFFTRFLEQPGGLVDYASAFLSPLCFHGALGALVITILTLLICLATRQLIRAVTGAGGRVLFLAPVILILVVLGQYIHPMRLCVGVLVALAFAVAYVHLVRRHAVVRLGAFVLMSGLVYFAAAGSYVLFACLCGVFELREKRGRVLGLFCLLCVVAVPLAADAWLWDLGFQDAYRGLTISPMRHWLAASSSAPIAAIAQFALLSFFPIATMALMWRRRFARRHAPSSRSNRAVIWSRGPVQVAILVALGIVADLVLFDRQLNGLLQVSYRGEQRQWEDVLKYARRLSSTDKRTADVRTVYEVNRALYYGGRLLDEMFEFPQGLRASTLGLVFEDPVTTATLTPCQCSDTLFDLGRINESEHMAYDALETYGDRPQLLKRLVYISVLKGEPGAARRFIGVMEASLLHRQWARDCRRQLDADPTLSDVPEVASSRERMVLRDSLFDVKDLEKMLLGLLEQNPRNRMAFEYLIAHYLLNAELEKFVDNLHRFDDFGYRYLPRHCEEALVYYLAMTGKPASDVPGPGARGTAWARLDRFTRTIEQLPDDASDTSISQALYADFCDSYFLVLLVGHNRQIH